MSSKKRLARNIYVILLFSIVVLCAIYFILKVEDTIIKTDWIFKTEITIVQICKDFFVNVINYGKSLLNNIGI